MPTHCTVQQLVSAADLHKDTIHRHKRAGYLPHERVPGVRSLSFHITEVRRWLNTHFPERAEAALQNLSRSHLP